MAFKLAGTTIKTPTEFEIEKFKLSKNGRLANGDMTFDVIARKKKFYFRYEVLDSVELQKIEAVVDAEPAALGDGIDDFFTLTYDEDGVEKTATVYPGAIKKKRFRTGSKWYWKDVTFDLIER